MLVFGSVMALVCVPVMYWLLHLLLDGMRSHAINAELVVETMNKVLSADAPDIERAKKLAEAGKPSFVCDYLASVLQRPSQHAAIHGLVLDEVKWELNKVTSPLRSQALRFVAAITLFLYLGTREQAGAAVIVITTLGGMATFAVAVIAMLRKVSHVRHLLEVGATCDKLHVLVERAYRNVA